MSPVIEMEDVPIWEHILAISLDHNIINGQNQHETKEMTGYIKKPHTKMFIGQTGCGKNHLVSELIEKEYKKHFDYIIVICSTLREDETYHAKEWIKNDGKVWLVEPKENLYQLIKKLSELLRFLEVLFIIDIIANKSLDKRRQPLLEYQVDIKVIIYGCLHSLILQYLKTCENRPRLSLCGIQRKGRSQSNT